MNGTAIKPSEGYIRTVADLHWKVKGENSCGSGPSSGFVDFSIGSGCTGGVPAPVGIGPSGTIYNHRPTFTWK